LSIPYFLSSKNVRSIDICYMIQNSDNEAASRIVDRLTSTQSIANNLSEGEYKGWLDQRRQLNSYFRQAGFKDINVSQKNFPIPYLKLDKPVGPELQMRGDPSSPYRNKISTAQASQVMYDIVNGQAVSPDKSQKMMELLNRYDLQTGAWKGKQYNEIEGFLGEGLDPNVSLLSKVGWTSESRQEVVRITSPDGRADYILVIFADHPAYAKDWKIFPNLSKFVYDKMIQNPTANIGDA
jgi:beta-lactamase class A